MCLRSIVRIIHPNDSFVNKKTIKVLTFLQPLTAFISKAYRCVESGIKKCFPCLKYLNHEKGLISLDRIVILECRHIEILWDKT